jgi:PadR family transcriptional regulator PadR
MIAEQIKSQMRKGILEYCVMQILQRGEIYASDIIEELQQARLLTVEGIIYPLLLKFKHEGLLKYEWVNSDSGLPKKNYQLTPEGLEASKYLTKEFHYLVKTTKNFESKLKKSAPEPTNEK